MLWVSTNVAKAAEFRKVFVGSFPDHTCVDLSKLPSKQLLEQADAITDHHTKSCVFLGYLDPGFMLSAEHQTLLRKLIRTFPVGFVCSCEDSIPFAWKNEIEVLYG
jgi:hypothetical protein